MRGLLVLLAWFAAPVWAADLDLAAPLEIEADRVVLDEAADVSEYRGSVRAVQGHTRLDADTLRLYRQGERLVRVVAEGNPARLVKSPPGRPTLEARARTIDYRLDQARVILSGEAVLVQGGDRFEGPRIEYDLNAQRVVAGGAPGDGRVRVILTPETLQGGEGGE